MTRDEGVRALGLCPTAPPDTVLDEYRRRSLRLKKKILDARSPERRDHYRDLLRDLIAVRDAALGETRRRRRQRPVGLSPSLLMGRLDRVEVCAVDAAAAKRFFGLPPDASHDKIEFAYDQDRRVLLREYARAPSVEAMQALRRARNKLRTLRNFAI